MDKKAARTFVRYIINNPNKAIKELEYLAYSNKPIIDKMPTLSDFGLSKESYKLKEQLQKEQQHKITIFFHFIFAFSVLICSVWYLCNTKIFNFWEFIIILLYPAPMLFFVLMSLLGIVESIFKINLPPFGDNKELQKLEKALKEYENALKEYEYQQNLKKRQYWEKMNGREFEIAVAHYFKNQGYNVELTQCSNDGGIDIILYSNNTKIYVQCKHYKNYVGIAPARELYGVMRADNVSYGYLVTMNGFTKGVYQFVNDKNIYLLTIDDLIQ